LSRETSSSIDIDVVVLALLEALVQMENEEITVSGTSRPEERMTERTTALNGLPERFLNDMVGCMEIRTSRTVAHT